MLAGQSDSGCYGYVQIICLDKHPNNTKCNFMKDNAVSWLFINENWDKGQSGYNNLNFKM